MFVFIVVVNQFPTENEQSLKLCFKVVNPQLLRFQSFQFIVGKLKVQFFPRKSARNCPPSKIQRTSKFCRFKFVYLCGKTGQFVKDFSDNNQSFFFFYLHITTQAMGIWRFAGAFAVHIRIAECGLKNPALLLTRHYA